MADELYSVLTKFHREVFVPHIQRIVGDAVAPLDARLSSVESSLKSFRNETFSHFDAMYKRLDRLESERAELEGEIRQE